MLKSANIGELVKAIAEAQTDYKALVATHEAKIPGKDGKAGYSYTYADLNDGLDALQGTLNSRGVAVIQEAYTVDRGIEVVTMLALGEQWMESKPLFMPVQGAAQAVGSAITYGRRYSLFPMVGLAPADDDGEEANRNAPPPSKPASKPRAPKPPPEDERPADDLGPRCNGKAAGIGKGIDERMQSLAKLRKAKLGPVWQDVLAEAGIDVDKYGPGVLRPELLTVADGTTVRDYLVRVLDDAATGGAPIDQQRTEAGKLWVQICQRDPDYQLDNWKAEWATFAQIDAWPDQPTAANLGHAIAGMTRALESINR